MKIGFTGTRNGMTDFQKEGFRMLLAKADTFHDDEAEFHHGDCVGADADAHDIADVLKWWTVIHPPLDPKLRAFKKGNFIHPPLPYIKRNRKIVEATDRLVATPKEIDEVVQSGTWSTIRYARKLGKPVTIICPQTGAVYNG